MLLMIIACRVFTDDVILMMLLYHAACLRLRFP